jgi:ABC-type lipoprotein export system ATPase subunit
MESFAVDTSELLQDDTLDEVADLTTLDSALALKDINLNIRHGEFVCIMGDVGSGKSSLLSAIIGDLQYLDPEFI